MDFEEEPGVELQTGRAEHGALAGGAVGCRGNGESVPIGAVTVDPPLGGSRALFLGPTSAIA